MISIHTNLSSIIAQESLKGSTNKLNLAVERMSSGYKINHAKDNAANYSIATNMTTKLGAYDIAQDNVLAGMDLVATASDTLSMMQDKASRLHALSTQARNGTYGAQSLNAINSEANAIMAEITRLYMTSQYNGIDLFSKKDYTIDSNLPQAKTEYNGFIANPKTYTDAEVDAMTKLETISDTTTISSGKYSISSVDELVQLAEMTNSGKITGGEFVLGADLDLSSIENWTPIGKSSEVSPAPIAPTTPISPATPTTPVIPPLIMTLAAPFKGVFDGNGHVIKNLNIDQSTTNCQGLFGLSQGTLKNVGIIDANIEGKNSVGILAGDSNGQITNCYVTGSANGENNVGGLVGKCSKGIQNCYSTASVNGNEYIGGLAGFISSSDQITNCYSIGNITGINYVGGLVGELRSKRLNMAGGGPKANWIIINCYSAGNVAGKSYTGGLIGSVNRDSGVVPGNASVGESVSYSKVKGQDTVSTGSFIGGNLVGSSMKAIDCQARSQNINQIGNLLGGTLTGISDVAIRDISTNLQVGINGDSSSQINFDTNFDLNFTLGSGIESLEAFNSINSFIDLLSEKQTQLGAVENRLESALDSITVNIENLASSRSTIRDADMAELSSTYIQQQILQEAAATLLATANQSPAVALQLI